MAINFFLVRQEELWLPPGLAVSSVVAIYSCRMRPEGMFSWVQR